MRAYIELSRQNLINNCEEIKKIVNKDIIAVVKCNAYGHGLVEISKILATQGIKMFAVSTIEEASLLRKNLIFSPILLLGNCDNITYASNYRITLSITSISYLKVLQKTNIPIFIHLLIDTGMNRDGISENEIDEAMHIIKKSKMILKGIFTHFASKDTYEKQLNIFNNVLDKIDTKNLIIHSQATSTFQIKNDRMTAIRVGLALYGLDDNVPNLKPVLSLKTPLVNEIKIENAAISYNQEQIQENGYIYTLPIGYGDGLKRENKYKVFINNEILSQVGITCMDHIMVYSKHQIDPKSVFEIFGENIQINNIANELNTIPYTIVSQLSSRLKRTIK